MLRDKKIKIIPCLDVRDGVVVKGFNFINLRGTRDVIEAVERIAGKALMDLFSLI